MNRKLITVLLSGFVGALITWLLVAKAREPKLLGTAPERFVSAQTLHVEDATGEQFGELYIGSDKNYVEFSLEDAEGLSLLRYISNIDGQELFLYGVESKTSSRRSSLHIMSTPELTFWLDPPDGRHLETSGKGWSNDALAMVLARAAYGAVFPPKPEHTIEDTIPTEDVRLIDRKKITFAVFGMTEGGEPGFALLDSTRKLLMSFLLSAPGYFSDSNEPRQWPTALLFDSRGKMRVMVELGPEPEPLLTIYENAESNKPDLGVYVLDPQTGKEIPKQHVLSRTEGSIPWLRHRMFQARLPVRLVDQRGDVIWNSAGKRKSDIQR